MTSGMFGERLNMGDVLYDVKVGTWQIEIDEGKPPRMYADLAMLELLGIEGIPEPEECYAHWYGRIDERYLDQVAECLKVMLSGRHGEVSYVWKHPVLGKIYVRCGGTADKNYGPGICLHGYHQDVSELMALQKKTEQLERENETMLISLRDLYQSIIMLELDKDRIYPIYVEEKDREIFNGGKTAKQMFRILSEHYHPEDQAQFEREISVENFKSLMERGEQKLIRQYRRRNGGTYRWAEIICYFIEKSTDRHQLLIAVRDIQEQKQQELEYQEYLKNRSKGNLELLRMSLKNTHVFEYFYYPKEDRIELPKETAEKCNCSCEYENMKDTFAKNMVDEEYYGAFCAMYDRIRDGAKSESLCYSSKNGKYWCRGSVTNVAFDEEGRGEFAVGIIEDISLQKWMEQENEMYQSIYKFTVDSEYDGIAILDLRTKRIEIKTTKAPKWSREDVEYKKNPGYQDFLHRMCGKDLKRYRQEISIQIIREHLDGGEEPLYFYYQEAGQPQGRHKQLGIRYFNAENTKLFISVRDIEQQVQSEEKNKEALSEAYEAAKNANEAKSEFFTKMSHDIRTPMNAIMGMATIAEANIDQKDRVQQCLGKIKIANQHLLRLVNEVLDMSRIENRKLDLSVEELNLVEALQGTVSMIQPQALQKRQELTLEIGRIAHPGVIGDGLRLQKVFDNILGNAVKYTQEGGSIRVSIEELPSLHPEYGSYRIVFRDNGYGMSEEFQKKIFEPFVRSRDPRIAAMEGTGLGMAITYHIVKMMQGDIQVESEWDKGSVFTVTLHLKLQEESSEANGQEEVSDLKLMKENTFCGKRALLVEDNDLNVEIAREILKIFELEVLVARDGREAVDCYLEQKPGYFDIVFMDIQMPVLDGYAAAEQIRNSGRADAADLPIVAMTANAFSEDVQKAVHAGMNDHIPKPIDLQYLRKVMTKWLS